MTLVITIPIPPDLCDPNKRTRSYHARARAIRDARGIGKMASKAAMNEHPAGRFPWNSATIDVRWYHPTKRLRDEQNIIATLKATVDGFQDSGLILNDNAVTWGRIERLVDPQNRRVELIVTRGKA